jgi:hypothetical protein
MLYRELEKFEDKKGVTESIYQRRTYNIMANRKRTNNDLHNTLQKIKDCTMQSTNKNEGEFGCSGRVGKVPAKFFVNVVIQSKYSCDTDESKITTKS